MAGPERDVLMRYYEKALRKFIKQDIQLIATVAHEQAMAHRIALYLEHACRATSNVFDRRYVVDCEYNRNGTRVKEIIDGDANLVEIRADVILHSRGLVEEQDNLIAIEMKILPSAPESLERDRVRLRAMTTPTFTNTVPWGTGEIPAAVCGYKLGVYLKIDSAKGLIDQEFFVDGHHVGDAEQISVSEAVATIRFRQIGVEVFRPPRRRSD